MDVGQILKTKPGDDDAGRNSWLREIALQLAGLSERVGTLNEHLEALRAEVHRGNTPRD
jgi:hypothetical protein